MSGELWQLGPLRVQPEQTLRGVFKVDVGTTQVDFPIALINGTEPDPVVLVTAGMDGDEHAASAAALRLIDTLDPTQLAGRVMVCPILDPLSFEALNQQNPLDGLYLRHVFPGNLEGKPTQRLAYFIYANFIQQADAWIDLHAVDPGENARPFVWTATTEDAELNEQNRLLLNQSGGTIGLRHTPYTWEPVEASLTASTPLLISQAGRRFQVEEDAVAAHLGVIGHILAGMDMIPAGARPEPTLYLDAENVLSEQTGVWQAQVEPGETVTRGQTLGQVAQLDGGSILQTVTSPVDGLVLTIRGGLAVRPRLRLALIAHRPAQAEVIEG